MARARDIVIRFLGEERDLVRSGKKVEGVAGKVTQAWKGFSTLMGGAVLGAVAGVVKVMGDMSRAALDDAKSVETLHAALLQNTSATDAQIAANDKWIDSMQIATLVADTDLRQAMQSLVSSGATLEESQRIIAVSIDTAAQRGLEFNTIVNAMIKAQNGQVQGLGRLGVATRDAAGEALTLDQILTQLEKTMGGAAAEAANTLAGGLERARIIMEEANETAGQRTAPTWSLLGDVWAQFTEFVKTGNIELSTLSGNLNDLVRQGIDPFIDKTGSAVEVLRDSLEQTEISRESFAVLRDMLAFTAEDTAALRTELIDNGEALGFNKEQIDALVMAMDLDAGPSGFHVMLARTKAGAEEAEDAVRNLADAQMELVSPTLALSNAANAVTDAEEKYVEAVREHSALSEEAERAGIDLAEAHLRLDAASATFAEEGGQASIDALIQILQDAGVLKETIDRVIESMKRLNSTPVKGNLFAAPQPTRPGQTRFDKGGVVPGPRGAPVTAIVHGGETILPTHKKPLAQFDDGTLGVGEVITSDGRRMTRTASLQYERSLARRQKFARKGSINMNVSGFADSVEAVRHANEIDRHLDRLSRQKAR